MAARRAAPAPGSRSFVALRDGSVRVEYRRGDVLPDGHPVPALRPSHFRAVAPVEQRVAQPAARTGPSAYTVPEES